MKIDLCLTSQPAAQLATCRSFIAAGGDGACVFDTDQDALVAAAVLGSALTDDRPTDAPRRPPPLLYPNIAFPFVRTVPRLAYQAIQAQVACRGQFVLGLGAGQPQGLAPWGYRWARPVEHMREVLVALDRCFTAWRTGGTATHEGSFVAFSAVPPPAAFDRGTVTIPPTWIGAIGPAMVRLAAELADGLSIHPLHTSSYIDTVVTPAIEDGLIRRTRPIADGRLTMTFTVLVVVETGDPVTDRRAWLAARSHLGRYCAEPLYRRMLDHADLGNLHDRVRAAAIGDPRHFHRAVPDDVAEGFVVRGRPAEVGAALRARYGAVADRVALIVYGDDSDAALQAVVAAAEASAPRNVLVAT